MFFFLYHLKNNLSEKLVEVVSGQRIPSDSVRDGCEDPVELSHHRPSVHCLTRNLVQNCVRELLLSVRLDQVPAITNLDTSFIKTTIRKLSSGQIS